MLERLAAELGIADRVQYLGFVSRGSEVRDLYRRAAVLALPSAYEGLPMVLLEAMSCGTPVVGSEIAAIAEVIDHGRTGLLVPVGAPDRLAAALRDAVSGATSRLCRAGRDPHPLRPDGCRAASCRRAARLSSAIACRRGGGMSAVLRRIVRTCGALTTFVGATGTGHLLLLLSAAVRARRDLPPGGEPGRLAVVIPAHDEAGQIEAAVRSVSAA